MPLTVRVLILTLAIGPAPAVAATFEVSPTVTGQINVTAGSSPGWAPTVDQQRRAMKAVQDYLQILEGGRYREAYDLQSEGNKRAQSLAQFEQQEQRFSSEAGAVKSWKVLKVTWTKDSPRASLPGTYAAFDLSTGTAATSSCTSRLRAVTLLSCVGKTTS